MKKEKEPIIRQVILTSLNESVSVLSGFESEDMNYLSCKAMALLKTIQSKESIENKE